MENSTETTQENKTTQDANALKALAKYCQTYLKLAKQDLSKLNSEQKQTAKKLKSFLEFYVQQQKAGTFKNTVFDASKKVEKTEHSKEDIGLSSFVNACLSWRNTTINFLNEKIKTHGEVKFSQPVFRDYLAREKSILPIVQALYKEWLTAIDQLKPEQDSLLGKVLFEALRNHQGKAWLLTADATKLESHYKKYRKYYRKVDGAQADFEQTSLPRIATFESALKAALSDEDPNTPENREAAEQAEKEAKKEAKAEYKEFQQAFRDWKQALSTELGTTAPEDSCLVSLKKVEVHLSKSLEPTAIYSKLLGDYLYMTIKKEVLESGDTITVGQLKERLIPMVANINTKIDFTRQYELWQQHYAGFLFPNTAGIHSSIKKAKLDVSQERFVTLVGEYVQKGLPTLIDEVALSKGWEKINDKGETKFSGKRFKSELSIVLSRAVEGITPLGFVQTELEAQVSDDVLSLDALNLTWKKVVQAAYSTAKNQGTSPYQTWLDSHAPWQIGQALDSIPTMAPNQAILTAVLEEARIRPKQQKTPVLNSYDLSQTTNFDVVIKWRSALSLVGVTAEEAAKESYISSLTTAIGEQFEGAKLVMDELKKIPRVVGYELEPLALSVQLPMKLSYYYDQSGQKQVAAIPANLDSSNIKYTTSGYYGIEVKKISLMTELPKYSGNNSFSSDTSAQANTISKQSVKISVLLTGPQIAVNSSAGIVGVELSKQPSGTTLDLICELYSDYNASSNRLMVNVISVSHTGAGNIIEAIELQKKGKLTMEVFK